MVAIETDRRSLAPSSVVNQLANPMRFFAGPVTDAASIIARIRTGDTVFTTGYLVRVLQLCVK